MKKRYKLIRNTTRCEKMLREKIDYAMYLTWFIENIPNPPKKQRTINTTIPSGNNSNNSPYTQ